MHSKECCSAGHQLVRPLGLVLVTITLVDLVVSVLVPEKGKYGYLECLGTTNQAERASSVIVLVLDGKRARDPLEKSMGSWYGRLAKSQRE